MVIVGKLPAEVAVGRECDGFLWDPSLVEEDCCYFLYNSGGGEVRQIIYTFRGKYVCDRVFNR